MKRRDFLKLPAAALAVVALPVSAKQKNSVVFDGVADYMDLNSGGFTLGNNHLVPSDLDNYIMWNVKDQQVVSKTAIVWPDITGNGNHLHGFREVRKFDVKHTEKENEEIIKAMARGEPDSYFKQFRGYKAKEISGAH